MSTSSESEETLAHLAEALRLASERSGSDFSGYKQAMLMRRLRRRMTISGAPSLNAYINRLKTDDQELARFQQDLLISVTRFFRDQEVFDALRSDVIPEIVARADTERNIRAWVPGCATGEEAYSLSIALLEALRERGADARVQIFATDIDEQALQTARNGEYPALIADMIAPDLLARYFTITNGGYRTNKRLRETVVFARQNVISDPPYSNLDLVSCRNLLIYLGNQTQKNVIAIFHFAIRDGGFLLLGNSETVGDCKDLFRSTDNSRRVFRRTAAKPRPAGFLGAAGKAFNALTRHTEYSRPQQAQSDASMDIDAPLRQLMLSRYVQPCVAVNQDMDILCTYGDVGRYLTLPTGTTQLNLMRMVDDSGLRNRLRAQIHAAAKTGESTSIDMRHPGRQDDARQVLRIEVVPLDTPAKLEGVTLVVFSPLPAPDVSAKIHLLDSANEAALNAELEMAHEELGASIKALEASNEDLRGSNEEVTSINEELQSTNEELETSKEELQSLNEELASVNTELNDKLKALEAANDDFANLLTLIDVAVVFLDDDARIKRFTPAVTRLIRLISSDVGRPLRDIHLGFSDDKLFGDIQAVLTDRKTRQSRVKGNDGRHYLRSLLPHRSSENRVEGVLIHLEDISDLQEASDAAHMSGRQLQLLTDALPAMILYVDKSKRIRFGNATASQWLGVSTEDLAGASIRLLFGEQVDDEWADQFSQALQGATVTFECDLNNAAGNRRGLQIVLTPEPLDSGDNPRGLHLLAFDITSRQRDEDDRAEDAARSALKTRDIFLSEIAACMAHQLSQPLNALSAYAGAMKRVTEKNENEELNDLARNISLHTRAAGDVIKQMRGFMEARQPIHERLDLRDVIETALTLTAQQRESAGISTSLNLKDDLRPVTGAHGLLEQMLINLINNATEALEKNSKKQLEIGTHEDDKHVLLWVRDSGPGMDEARMARAFEAFATTKASGMGLGLAICRSVMEEHGGNISIQSSAQEGTTVTCRFPISE